MKATTSTPKRGSKENVKEGDTLKRRNEVWISNTNLNSSPRPKRLSAGKTLKVCLELYSEIYLEKLTLFKLKKCLSK